MPAKRKKISIANYKWWPLQQLKSELKKDTANRSCCFYSEIGCLLGENLEKIIDGEGIFKDKTKALTFYRQFKYCEDVRSWLQNNLPEFLEHIPDGCEMDCFLEYFILTIQNEYAFLLPENEEEMTDEEVEKYYETRSVANYFQVMSFTGNIGKIKKIVEGLNRKSKIKKNKEKHKKPRKRGSSSS